MLFVLLACLPARAQAPPAFGSIKLQAKSVKIGPKEETLKRKRFYLLPGGLEANKALIEKLRAAEPVARACFYCRSKASAGFISWLEAENCESPYCREVTAEDIKKVPEFQVAYRKGLKQFGRRRTELARKWIVTNLPASFRDGFYRQKRTLLASLLGDIKPLQSVMTDRNAAGVFIDIAVDAGAKKGEKFLISNILPIEMDGKGYIWACEVNVIGGKQVAIILEERPIPKKCEVIVRPLPACAAAGCQSK